MTKPKPKAEDPGVPDPNQSITITRAELEAAVNENSLRKLGSQPIEGQVDDLWARLGGK